MQSSCLHFSSPKHYVYSHFNKYPDVKIKKTFWGPKSFFSCTTKLMSAKLLLPLFKTQTISPEVFQQVSHVKKHNKLLEPRKLFSLEEQIEVCEVPAFICHVPSDAIGGAWTNIPMAKSQKLFDEGEHMPDNEEANNLSPARGVEPMTFWLKATPFAN